MSVAYDYKVRTNYVADIPKLRAAHKQLAQVRFTPSLPERGYTRRTLSIDLGTMTITEKAVTDEMIDTFVGGRGFGLYYLWQAVTPQTKYYYRVIGVNTLSEGSSPAIFAASACRSARRWGSFRYATATCARATPASSTTPSSATSSRRTGTWADAFVCLANSRAAC